MALVWLLQALVVLLAYHSTVAVVIEPADRLSPAKQCVTDGFLHRLARDGNLVRFILSEFIERA